MRLRLTRYESRWLLLYRTLIPLVLGIFLLLPILPANKSAQEPLADPASLQALLNGKQLPLPPQEPSAEFHGSRVRVPTLASLLPITRVLGQTVGSGKKPFGEAGGKRIDVDLTNQKVYAFEGNTKVYEFTVSTGKWAPTPTGEFRIWAKVRSQKMEGGRREWGTYYNLPNVPFVMFFANDEVAKMRGFSFHGTYWHNNFGHPMSHGCVNMKIPDAQTLYDWADPPVTNPKAWSTLATGEQPGTRVVIYGETPKD